MHTRKPTGLNKSVGPTVASTYEPTHKLARLQELLLLCVLLLVSSLVVIILLAFPIACDLEMVSNDYTSINVYVRVVCMLYHYLIQVPAGRRKAAIRWTKLSEFLIRSFGELLEGLIPYSQRHFSRIDRLVRSTFLLDYTLNGMPSKNLLQKLKEKAPSKKRKSNKSKDSSRKKVKSTSYTSLAPISVFYSGEVNELKLGFMAYLALTIDCSIVQVHASVGSAALKMVKEVRRQFNTIPGLMEGTAKPNCANCVKISTDASLREMIPPGPLVMLTPLITRTLFGVETLAVVLAGALIYNSCICSLQYFDSHYLQISGCSTCLC
ncbi:unnamed protein product [Dovyalis caffra]|uniref:H(+)-exporting diphosphatase n=1 Tax=Dovyalis caffra TaxID=77055 RepID=A0AAV1SNL0_9ROSI|nr:unnamed protein product [Dovyalis caffra]